MLTISSTAQTPSAGRGGKPGLNRTLLVVIIIVIVVGAVAAIVATTLFFVPSLSVTMKSITPYSTPVSSDSNNPSSLTVVNTNGGITITPWSHSDIMINGTATSRGFGTSPDAITYIETNNGGDTVFQSIFPAAVFLASASYTLDLNVYAPSTAQFKSVQISTVNGNIQVSNIDASRAGLSDTNGNIVASSVSASSLMLTDTNGNLDFSCASCSGVTATTTNGAVTGDLTSTSLTGSYTLTSTNGNVSLKISINASARITADAVNGSVSSSGITVLNHTTTILDGGIGVISLTTTNGLITVTGM